MLTLDEWRKQIFKTPLSTEESSHSRVDQIEHYLSSLSVHAASGSFVVVRLGRH